MTETKATKEPIVECLHKAMEAIAYPAGLSAFVVSDKLFGQYYDALERADRWSLGEICEKGYMNLAFFGVPIIASPYVPDENTIYVLPYGADPDIRKQTIKFGFKVPS